MRTVAGGSKVVTWSASRPPSASSSARALALSATLPPPMAIRLSAPNVRTFSAIVSTKSILECRGTVGSRR